MFLPTTREEMDKLQWKYLDVILVSGDTYIDSPYIGISIIGQVLLKAGYKVGIIAQPAIDIPEDIQRLGEPRLFWGITAGSVDSMIANYTATGKKRNKDDYTPGGSNDCRPDRATIVYCNLIKRYYKNTRPIVLGGIEASLRRIAHYDYWDNRIRRSILFDSKADILIYGMAEKSILQLADKLSRKEDYRKIKGICYISNLPEKDSIILPSFSEVKDDKQKFIEMFHQFYKNQHPYKGKILSQKHGDRYLIQNPPALPLTEKDLDKIYELDYQRDVHPFYKKMGHVRALDTIKFSVTSHRGCFGECNFCAITVHQGKIVQSRSESSILREVKKLTKEKDFKGYILDIGGPTANMYGMGCNRQGIRGHCISRRCLFPAVCPNLNISHESQLSLLRKISKIEGVKKVFVASGIRFDLVMTDKKSGKTYLKNIIQHNTSGQLKVAPEHICNDILILMGKENGYSIGNFKKIFDSINQRMYKKQYLTYYFIAAHPGCSDREMIILKRYIQKELHIRPEQVQIFIPAPSTYSGVMYYTKIDPFSGKTIFVEKRTKKKEKQKKLIINS